ncbi:uncharacterized protein LOC110007166, partial [Amborella trichopoda]
MLVWYCAEIVHPGKHFTSYAILGDDVVIGDPEVAKLYAESLDQLGVSISFQKSVISDTGCLEFAKRFRIRRGTVDISPISIRALLSYSHPYGLMAINHKSNVKRFTTLLRIGGFGYK